MKISENFDICDGENVCDGAKHIYPKKQKKRKIIGRDTLQLSVVVVGGVLYKTCPEKFRTLFICRLFK